MSICAYYWALRWAIFRDDFRCAEPPCRLFSDRRFALMDALFRVKKIPADKLFENMRPEVRELERKARANMRYKKRADWWAKNGAKRNE